MTGWRKSAAVALPVSMDTKKKPCAPKKVVGGTTDQGKNSKVDWKSSKSPLTM